MKETNQKPASLIAVTGASGHLGRLVIESLLAKGLPAAKIVAIVRDPEKVADFAAQGVQVRRADYERQETLDEAFAGVGRLLLVSSNELNRRLPQHENVVKAARNAGVGFLAYTSILKADSATMKIAADHKATEQVIRESGVQFAFLRNGWYIENYTDQIAGTLQHGVVIGNAGDGRISAASRADYADAAAVVLAGNGHENKIYELGGDRSFTLSELAAEISAQSGRTIVYRNLPVEELAQTLIKVGLPEPLARVLADADSGIERGELFTENTDLTRLINRPTAALAEVVATALKK